MISAARAARINRFTICLPFICAASHTLAHLGEGYMAKAVWHPHLSGLVARRALLDAVPNRT